MVRLPKGAMEQRFVDLCRRFRGLPPSAVMRMLVCDLLTRPVDEQVKAVDRQIRGEEWTNSERERTATRNTNRLRSGRD